MTTTHDVRHIFKGLVMNPISASRVEFHDPGYLVVRDGTVERLAAHDPRSEYPGAEFHDFGEFSILPGFVDVHVHLPQLAIVGVGSESLLDWLNDYTFPEEARFARPEYARQIAELFFSSLVRNGTTCASIYSSVHETATDIAFETASRFRIRAFIGKAMMDRHAPAALLEDTEASVQASLRLWEKWDGAHNGRLRYAFTPRFAGSCSMELMRRVGALAAERKAFVQSHLSENQAEVAWIRGLFPDRRSYADVYATAGLLGSRSIMAHCIYLSDAEVAQLRDSETAVAYCPYSNRMLHSGLMPYSRLKHAGLRIGLGSDVGACPTLSMFRQMGEALNSANTLSPSLSVESALYLATLGGAEILGLSDRIGNFVAGKDADFIVVDHRRLDPLAGTGSCRLPETVLSRLCFNGDAACVRQTYIQGQAASG